MTYPVSQFLNSVGGGGTSTSPFLNIFAQRDPNGDDLNYPVGKRWINTITVQEFILLGFISSQGYMQANWQPMGSVSAVEEFITNLGGPVVPNTLSQVLVNASTTTYTDGTTANTLKTEVQGTLNQIFVGQGADTPATTITTVDNGVLITGNTGIPAFLANSGTAGYVLTANTGAPPSWQASAGDVTSITATAPLKANGVSGTPETGAVTIALTDPLTVPYGGTGIQTATAYAPITAGTTATGAFQAASTGLSTAGYIFTSTGASSLPSFQIPSASTGWQYLTLAAPTMSNTITINFLPYLATYTQFMLIGFAIQPASTPASLTILASTDGSTYASTGYQSGIMYWKYTDSGPTNQNSTAAILVTSAMGPYTTNPLNMNFQIFMSVQGSGQYNCLYLQGQSAYQDNASTTWTYANISAIYPTGLGSPVQAIQMPNVLYNAPTRIVLYGMKTS